jgi:rhodanese-related sulfurtransferase
MRPEAQVASGGWGRRLRAVREAGCLLLVALVPAVVVWVWHPGARVDAGSTDGVSVAVVRQWPAETVLWVDARNEDEYRAGHLPGALSLPEARWEQQLPVVLEKWLPELRVVVYCGGQACQASQRVARRLREDLGAEEVYYLEGGYEAWRREVGR